MRYGKAREQALCAAFLLRSSERRLSWTSHTLRNSDNMSTGEGENERYQVCSR